MTLEEARKVGMIAGTADGGCSTCVGSLVERLNAAFPEFVWTETGDYQREQPEWSDDPEDERDCGVVVAVAHASP